MAVLGYLLVFALGAAAGWFYARFRGGDERAQELEAHLRALQAKYDHYQESVTQHFTDTARLSNQLTQSWRELHEQLHRGADALCADNKRHSAQSPAHAFLPVGADVSRQQAHLLDDDTLLAQIHPPRDYATKQPDEQGTLSEHYGLKR